MDHSWVLCSADRIVRKNSVHEVFSNLVHRRHRLISSDNVGQFECRVYRPHQMAGVRVSARRAGARHVNWLDEISCEMRLTVLLNYRAAVGVVLTVISSQTCGSCADCVANFVEHFVWAVTMWTYSVIVQMRCSPLQ